MYYVPHARLHVYILYIHDILDIHVHTYMSRYKNTNDITHESIHVLRRDERKKQARSN